MGLNPTEAKSSFRFSLGRPTKVEEVDEAARIFVEAVQDERAISPVWQMIKSGIDFS
jgi:cysteine desulfurase